MQTQVNYIQHEGELSSIYPGGVKKIYLDGEGINHDVLIDRADAYVEYL